MRIDVQMPRQKRKQRRAEKVNKIVVTVRRGDDALLFDGDEDSQRRMFMYSQRMRANNIVAIPWVLADNSVVEVTVEELEQAIDLAMEQQGELWFI